MKRITLSTFRRMTQAEEAMLRAVMPRVSASNPEPLEFVRVGRELPPAKRILTYRMAEVNRG